MAPAVRLRGSAGRHDWDRWALPQSRRRHSLTALAAAVTAAAAATAVCSNVGGSASAWLDASPGRIGGQARPPRPHRAALGRPQLTLQRAAGTDGAEEKLEKPNTSLADKLASRRARRGEEWGSEYEASAEVAGAAQAEGVGEAAEAPADSGSGRSAGYGRRREAEKKPNGWEELGTNLLVVLASLSSAAIVGAVIVGGIFYSLPQLRAPENLPAEVRYESWYVRAFNQVRMATNKVLPGKKEAGPAGVPESIVKRIRGMARLLDITQRDVYEQDIREKTWIVLTSDVKVLRGHLALCDYYIKAAFPRKPLESPVIGETRKALRYELDKLSLAIDKFEKGVEARGVRQTEQAFAEMSVTYDRYLKAAKLYACYDPVASTDIFYAGISDEQLSFVPAVLQKPALRDEVLVIRGPDKGKVGRVIWKYQELTAVVKLEPNPLLGSLDSQGVREVKAFPQTWIALTRTSQQNLVLDLVLGAVATTLSACINYPIETVKSRVQAGLPLLPNNSFLSLYKGLPSTLFREIPAKSMYIAGFNLLTRSFCASGLIDTTKPDLKLLVMIPAGMMAYFVGTFTRAPGELLSRQMQTGAFEREEDAFQALVEKDQDDLRETLLKAWILVTFRGVPFGALQLTLYDFLRENAELVQYGVPVGAQPLVWGALSGAITGLATNPADLMASRVLASDKKRDPGSGAAKRNAVEQLLDAAAEVSEKQGPLGFFQGASVRALQIGLESCLFFTILESLKSGVTLADNFFSSALREMV